MVDILCIGYACYDLFYYLDDYPEENKKYMTSGFAESGGGPAANAAYLLSKWGVATAFAGLVGDDAEGEKILREFEKIGTDTSLVEIRRGCRSPLSSIIVNTRNGTRTIVTRRGAEGGFGIDTNHLEALRPKIVLCDGWQYEATLRALAKIPSAVSILDAGSLRDATADLVGKCNYTVCSEHFAKAFCDVSGSGSDMSLESRFSRLFAAYGRNAAVTLGERGVAFLDGGRVELLNAPAVNAIDTTAAGDIFHGAFAYAILKGHSFRDALYFAMYTASLSVTVTGGRSSIPELSDVNKWLRDV